MSAYWKAIPLSVIPGAGHIYLHRYLQGFIFFALFATAANGVLVGAFWQGEAQARLIFTVSAIAAPVIWLASLAHVLKLTIGTDREALALKREGKLREALVHYLRDEHAETERRLGEARRLDVDRCDADVLFYLGAVRLRLGDDRGARRLFRQCLACDSSAKWEDEVERELEAAETAPVPAAAAAAAAGGGKQAYEPESAAGATARATGGNA